ncbi:MAG: trypsin-like peptidase domain-containing protein [Alphaproteobacteria bacterium]
MVKIFIAFCFGVFCYSIVASQSSVSYSHIVKKVSPAVVDITSLYISQVISPFVDDPFFKFFFEGMRPQKQTAKSSGSGVIISQKGLIVTCAHVVKGADKVIVHLSDGSKLEVKLRNIDTENDIALLEPKEKEDKKFPYLNIGDSDESEVGDVVLAFGNAFELGQTVTVGIISALYRSIFDKMLIQTDASVNPGNSGGALVNMNGDLVGLPNAIFSKTGASHGIGFAIPSILIKAKVRRLDADKKAPWFGVYTQTLDSNLLQFFNDKGLNVKSGIIITELHDKSSAKSILQKDDIIVEVNGKGVSSVAEFLFRQQLGDVGDQVSFAIYRKESKKNVQIKPIIPPEEPKADKRKIKKGLLKGVAVANLSPALAVKYKLDDRKKGVAVIEVKKRKRRAHSFFDLMEQDTFLSIGDIIKKINGLNIQSAKHLEELSDNVQTLHVERDNDTFVIRTR